MPARRVPQIPAIWLVLMSILSVQTGAAFGKGLFDQVSSPLAVAWLRLAFGALMLWVTVRPWRAFAKRDEISTARRLLVLAAFTGCLIGMNVFIYLAFAHLPIGIAITLEFMGPLAVAVSGSRRVIDFLWILLAAAGVVMLGARPGHIDVVGIVLALAAAALWAAYILLGSHLNTAWRGVDALAIACAAGALLMAPGVVPHEGARLLNPVVLATGAVVAVLSTVVPYTLELAALQRIPKPTFSILMSLQPAAAALAGLVVLREQLGLVDVVAMACVIGASIGSTRSRR